MRLGEIRNILNTVIDANFKIVIEAESIFGGHAYSLTNYASILEALNILSQQSWNPLDDAPLQVLKSK